MTTDTRAKPAVGKASLIVNCSVQDDAHVMFHRHGNDIIRLEKLVTLKCGEVGDAFVDLQDHDGRIIGASDWEFLQKGDRYTVGTFRAIKKVKIK